MLQPQRNVCRVDNSTLRLTIKSLFSGREHTKELPITHEQWHNWQSGCMKIQHAMPHLSADDREWLMTGATPDEWEAEFGQDD